MDCDGQKFWHNPDDIYLLTKREGRAGRISALGLDITDLAVRIKKTRTDILPVRCRASLVKKRFITQFLAGVSISRDHSGQCPVQY